MTYYPPNDEPMTLSDCLHGRVKRQADRSRNTTMLHCASPPWPRAYLQKLYGGTEAGGLLADGGVGCTCHSCAACGPHLSPHCMAVSIYRIYWLTAQRFADAPFVSVSQNQRAPLPGLNWVGIIHHGLSPDLLKLSDRPQGYLPFLGQSAWRMPRASRSALLPRCLAPTIAISTRASNHSLVRTMSSSSTK